VPADAGWPTQWPENGGCCCWLVFFLSCLNQWQALPPKTKPLTITRSATIGADSLYRLVCWLFSYTQPTMAKHRWKISSYANQEKLPTGFYHFLILIQHLDLKGKDDNTMFAVMAWCIISYVTFAMLMVYFIALCYANDYHCHLKNKNIIVSQKYIRLVGSKYK